MTQQEVMHDSPSASSECSFSILCALLGGLIHLCI